MYHIRTWMYHSKGHNSVIMRSKEQRLDVIIPLIVYETIQKGEEDVKGMACENRCWSQWTGHFGEVEGQLDSEC